MKRFAFLSVFLGLFAVGMLLAGVALAQTGTGGDTTLDVTITNSAIQVSPSDASLAINEPFTLTVLNSSDVTRSIELQSVDASGVTNTASVVGGQAIINNIAPSERQTVTWTLDQPGNYQLFSAVENGSALVAPFTVSGAAAVTGTEVATETVAATVAATDTPAATETTEATATSEATAEATATSAVTITSAATSTAEAAPALQVTGTVTATGTATGGETATATSGTTLPTTGGTDDSLPTGLILIVAGTLFIVTGLFVGRRLVRSR